MRFHVFRRLIAVLVQLCLLGMMALQPGNARAIDEISGGGYIPEQGEFICDQFWTNDDTINLWSELITSGGAVTFQLGYLGLKYVVGAFFEKGVKPLEFWIGFIQFWMNETHQRAPEDFRMMTGYMLDPQVDISWLAVKCANLSKVEGWDKILDKPFAFQDDSASVVQFNGDFANYAHLSSDLSEGSPEPALPNLPPLSAMGSYKVVAWVPRGLIGAGAKPAFAAAASPSAPVPVTAPSEIVLKCKNSKNFEMLINEAVAKGEFENSLGIPAGSRYLNLSYHGGAKGAEAAESLVKGGVNGVDGFFVTPSGKCHLLEMKWYEKGGGTLGEIAVNAETKITQASPEWLHKALYSIKIEDPERFTELMAKVEGTRFKSFMEMVDYIHFNRADIGEKCNMTEREIENFGNLDKIFGYMEKNAEHDSGLTTLMEDVGNFVDKDLNVGIITKYEGKIRNEEKVAESMGKWVKRLLGKVEDAAEHVVEAKVKSEI